MSRFGIQASLAAVVVACLGTVAAAEPRRGPYDAQVNERLAQLRSPAEAVRAGAAEALGFLRAYSAAEALAGALRDDSAAVRREAAIALGACGGRRQVPSLLAALADDDWIARQAAAVSLTNLTGMRVDFDALADRAARDRQAAALRAAWADVPPDRAPPGLLALLPATRPPGREDSLALRGAVTTSTAYKGPPDVLADGEIGPAYWQTKNVPFPQHCTVDLGRERPVGCIVVHQYGPRFCMTDFAVSTSLDGKAFETAIRRQGRTDPRLVIGLDPPPLARYVRITSHAAENATYPTTFFEVEVFPKAPPALPAGPADAGGEGAGDEGLLCAVRALGALGGQGAVEALSSLLAGWAGRPTRSVRPIDRFIVQAALRGLGRLAEPTSLELVARFLADPYWARYAADALGDFGGERAAAALLAAYEGYARDIGGRNPRLAPADDRVGFSDVDRMHETPFAIAAALSRIAPADEANLAALRRIAPLLVANLPNDFDGAMLYEPEAAQQVTGHLLDSAGLRRAAVEAAFASLGAPARVPAGPQAQDLAAAAKRVDTGVPLAAALLPALCRDADDVPRLTALLTHANGWARINAAKALMFLGDGRPADPIAELLAASRPEADFGYCPTFILDEYNAPAPRWREAMVRALGRLGSPRHAELLADLTEDDRNVLEVRYAAAVGLDELGGPQALAALRRAAEGHSFHSVRMVAREALWRRGLAGRPAGQDAGAAGPLGASRPPRGGGPEAGGHAATPSGDRFDAVVFIQGPNRMPNCFQIDIWRQTYSTTDSGPTYRVGRNLCILSPARPDGKVTALTSFEDGYVADCEVSWDARRVVFARRGQQDPWWHIWDVELPTAGGTPGRPRQLTFGPYHDVQPAWLPDGRIVLSTSRIGTRDEYHGYPCTGLAVMDADGGRLDCIGFNLGRDNEPCVLPDGRIAFSRLEVFYSRLKTELTVQAAFPDGTRNVTLYGPERRDFWREVTRQSGERWWGEAPSRHRVLRLTQPQPFGDHAILCASTGGLTLVGQSRYTETILPHDKSLAVTSPMPLADGRVLCAAAVKKGDAKGKGFSPDVDLGLYAMDASTGAMTLLYNDPAVADFEPRPIVPRPPPPVLPCGPPSDAYTGRLLCQSVFHTRDEPVRTRGRLVRVVEGLPIVGRHGTHTSPGEVWRNHTGTLARVLGTVPLAADGSVFLEVPADRLIHLQVLDSDRQVVGNQLVWMYVRPGETRSCAGCHEHPEATTQGLGHPLAASRPPVPCLPTGGEFTYRAKVWRKGELPDQVEERTRTVRAVNLLGR